MSNYEKALKEFFENGGQIETLEYKGPKESDVVFTKRKNVSRESVVEKELDSVVEEIEGLEDLTAPEAH